MEKHLNKVLLTIGLALLALGGNVLSLHLFFGVDFIFGSIAVMLAIKLLGTVPALITALCGGLYTVILWNHPYALITFSIEAIVVSALYRRGMKNLVLADLFYWLTLGLPQILFYYAGPIGMNWDSVMLIALKQPLNGIFNALCAGLIIVICQRVRSRTSFFYMASENISKLLFHSLLTIIMLVGAAPIVYNGYQSQQMHQSYLEEQLLTIAQRLKLRINEIDSADLQQLERLLQSEALQDDVGVTLLKDGKSVLNAGLSLNTNKQKISVGQYLTHIAPDSYISTMQRWHNGQFAVQLSVSQPLTDRLVVTKEAQGVTDRIKKDSLHLFILLCFIASVGILITIYLSRVVTNLLTRLSRVASQTTNAVVITNLEGQVEWVNEGFTRITGYSLNEVIGNNPGDVLQGPETNQQTVTEIRHCIAQGKSFDGKILNYSKEGRQYWLHLNINPLRGMNDELEGFIAIETDITKTMGVEQELQSFKSTLDQTLDCVFMFDAETLLFTYANAGAVAQVGYTLEELVHKQPFEIKPDYDLTKFKEVINPLMSESGKSKTFITIHQHKDGQQIQVEIFLQYIESEDEPAHFVAVVRDISERLKIQTELYEQVNRTQTIVNTMVDGLITITEQGLVDSFNAAAEQIFGYESKEVVGENIKMLMPSPYQESHDQYLRKYKHGGEAKIIGIGREVEGLRKDGSVFPMELAVSEATHSGQPLYVGLVRDITERKRLERLKSEFISTVSHELRTPLTSIRGAISLLIGKSGNSLDSKLKRMLELAQRNTERLTLLINDLLDLEKIESGRMSFDFKELDLVELAQRSLEDNIGYAKEHNVSLKLEASIDEAITYGDTQRLMQVVANLISNAVKYSPQDKAVIIKVYGDELSRDYCISVKDKGAGIPEEFKSRIFQRFAQADSSDTRDKGGTGLGLSISKAIIGSHQGEIGYETEQGKGTEFFIKLKARPRVKFDLAVTDKAAKVLICEDDQDFVSVLTQHLADKDLNCDVALSLAEARQLLNINHYAVLLLDLLLPDGNGVELLNEIRSNDDTKDLPVIIISASLDKNGADSHTDFLTVLDCLQKPVDMTRLNQSLQTAIAHSDRPHILHIEDDLDVVEMTQALVDSIADFSYATTVKDARKMLANNHYNLVILDLDLSDGNGIELLELIKRKCPVLVFSGETPTSDLFESVNSVLTKSLTNNDDLLNTIELLLKR